jgi:hypothetical protein
MDVINTKMIKDTDDRGSMSPLSLSRRQASVTQGKSREDHRMDFVFNEFHFKKLKDGTNVVLLKIYVPLIQVTGFIDMSYIHLIISYIIIHYNYISVSLQLVNSSLE